MSKLVFKLAQMRVGAHETILENVALTDWHTYRLDWRAREAIYFVDDVEVARAANPPTVSLGFVAWIDNNYTTMGPGRDFFFGRMAIAQRQWMELARVSIEKI